MKRIAFTTLGCKANWSDTEALIQSLSKAGFEIVRFDGPADIYIINTCTVTALADSQSRQMLRRAKRRSPDSLVIAAGCYAEISKEDLESLKEVDRAFGTKERDALVEYLFELSGHKSEGIIENLPVEHQSRARAFVKIQDGCNKRCAYCIIHLARGKSRSIPVDKVIQICHGLSQFHHEIVLAGIDIGQYGRDLDKGTTFLTLLEKLNHENGLARIRLSTLGPKEISEKLVQILAYGNFCRHIHLSIQSLSDNVLARMGRGYSAVDVKRAANVLANKVPGIAITGDVIAGFPGESEDDHRATLDALSSLPLAGLHVFPFSARSKTRAAKMEGQIPHDVKRERAFEIRELALGKRKQYLSSLIRNVLDVIVTSKHPRDDGLVEGVADNGVHVLLPDGIVKYGEMGAARITEITDLNVRGIWESNQTKRQGSNSLKPNSDIVSSEERILSAL